MLRWVGLAALWAGVLIALAPAASWAQNDNDTTITFDTMCTDHYAQWRTVTNDSNDLSIGARLHEPDQPPGTETKIFACRVAGHWVRINYREYYPPSYLPPSDDDCNGHAGGVSAWVDGVKVANEGWSNCDTGDGVRRSGLAKLIVNSALHMTTCKFKNSVPGAKPKCSLVALSLDPKKSIPIYDGAIRRSKPGVFLASGDAAFCRSAIAEDNTYVYGDSHMVDEGSPLWKSRLSFSANKDLSSNSMEGEESGAFDLDNDGVIDNIHRQSYYLAGRQTETIEWTSGRDGKYRSVDKALDGEAGVGLQEIEVAFLHLAGRNYVFENASVSLDTPINKPQIFLYEIHSDGEAKQLCAWQARKRPEEEL